MLYANGNSYTLVSTKIQKEIYHLKTTDKGLSDFLNNYSLSRSVFKLDFFKDLLKVFKVKNKPKRVISYKTQLLDARDNVICELDVKPECIISFLETLENPPEYEKDT